MCFLYYFSRLCGVYSCTLSSTSRSAPHFFFSLSTRELGYKGEKKREKGRGINIGIATLNQSINKISIFFFFDWFVYLNAGAYSHTRHTYVISRIFNRQEVQGLFFYFFIFLFFLFSPCVICLCLPSSRANGRLPFLKYIRRIEVSRKKKKKPSTP